MVSPPLGTGGGGGACGGYADEYNPPPPATDGVTPVGGWGAGTGTPPRTIGGEMVAGLYGDPSRDLQQNTIVSTRYNNIKTHDRITLTMLS